LIVHTHTTEGYLLDIKNLNKSGINSYTSDPRYNVVRIGEELKQNLSKNYGIEAIHNGTVHDSNFNAAYGKSLNTVESILKSYPSIRLVIDLHRDGLGDNKKLRTAVKINGKSAARVMFVVGTNQNLNHTSWKENFKLAIKLYDGINELYPGLTRPIDLSYNRYNQHLSNGALIMEVGGDGDTLDEALETTKYLSRVISEVIK
jgi:stage II sporulation protein P